MIPTAGSHGGDGARVAAALGRDVADVLDLSASMNPVAPDPRPVVGRHLDALGRYPDPGAASAALAEAMAVDGDRLLLTNGGAEAIALVAAETGPGWADACDFSLYRRHLPGLDPSGPRWRSDPHNPLGTLAEPEVRADVWDEAFYPLATGRWTAGRPGFTLGSLTKLLACPGLRAGYVVCPDAAARRRLARHQARWAVNGLVCAALPELLAAVDLAGWARAISSLRADLVALLESHGLRVRPGATANWVLVDGASDLRARLAAYGVVVRDCTSFGLPGVHRVAVPSTGDLPRLAAALAASRRFARGAPASGPWFSDTGVDEEAAHRSGPSPGAAPGGTSSHPTLAGEGVGAPLRADAAAAGAAGTTVDAAGGGRSGWIGGLRS